MDSLDNHPIPQDVTHFQFRLIGDMTIKQFGYLAAGLGLAWFVFAIPFFILIKILFVPGFAFLGILLAFIPIEGRPADIILTKFVRALFIPDQYIFKKTTGDPLLSSLLQAQKSQTIALQPATTTQALPQANRPKEHVLLQTVAPAFKPVPLQKATVSPRPFTSSIPLAQVRPIQPSPVVQTTQPITPVVPMNTPTNTIPVIQPTPVATQQSTSIISSPPPVEETSHVNKIPPPLSKGVSAPMVTDVPNLITGIVKDSRGNVLPNILIEVKDKDNNPVRAFKTNQLGQFASATPLLEGTYTIFFEDPAGKHKFDTIEVKADGTILLPIEIISIDGREELRKELFG